MRDVIFGMGQGWSMVIILELILVAPPPTGMLCGLDVGAKRTEIWTEGF